jgi:hypothetical protein
MPGMTTLRNCFALLSLMLASSLQARVMDLRVASMHSSVANAAGVHARIDWPDAAVQGRLLLDIDALDAADFGYRFRQLHWDCALIRDGSDGWRCSGLLRNGSAKPFQLTLVISPSRTSARLADGRAAVGIERNASAPDSTRLSFEHVPIAWLRPYVATLWASARVQKGVLDGSLMLSTPERGPIRVQGPLAFSGFGLDTPDGTIAADGVNAQLQFDYRQAGAQRSIGCSITLHGGEFLDGGFYAKLPQAPVTIALQAAQSGHGDWVFPLLRWNDGAVLTAQGDARYSSDLATMRSANLDVRSGDLAMARDRYLSGWLGQAGFADLGLRGGVQATIALAGSGLQQLRVVLDGIDAVDAKQRFAFKGLNGDLGWTAMTPPVTSSLRLSGGALYGIALGATTLPLHSASRQLTLAQAANVPMVGGVLALEHFALTPADATHGARFVLGIDMRKLQLAPLAKAFGWPAFSGTLDGRLPAARYENDTLAFDGGLDAQVFGGRIEIGKLVMERPFGVAPTLSADIGLDDLDLKSLTSVFGFGEITGRLDGSIRALRLLDWSPEAFDADLHSDPNHPDKRRISQRAVRDLSNVGGSGIAGGLQAQVLKVFQDFGYARLGLKCRLENNVCHMGGIDPLPADAGSTGSGSAGAGYTIVEGSGLPRITVVGFQREVDWPTLVSRLKAATEGNGPVIK